MRVATGEKNRTAGTADGVVSHGGSQNETLFSKRVNAWRFDEILFQETKSLAAPLVRVDNDEVRANLRCFGAVARMASPEEQKT